MLNVPAGKLWVLSSDNRKSHREYDIKTGKFVRLAPKIKSFKRATRKSIINDLYYLLGQLQLDMFELGSRFKNNDAEVQRAEGAMNALEKYEKTLANYLQIINPPKKGVANGNSGPTPPRAS